MIEHDDDADVRADSFLSGLVPQVADRLAARQADSYDVDAGQERFAAWLAHANGKPPRRQRRYGSGPDRPGRTLGRWLRMCAGIREDVLDWVPEERARYTGLGIVIVNTACLAAFAMFSAIDTILAAPTVILVFLALAWGWINFSVDRWLITSTHAVREARRLRIFLPRLALAAVLAITISEPLALRAFHNTLDVHARTTQISNYASQLQTCNPVSGQLPRPATCAGYILDVPGSPYTTQQNLATARQQQTQLQQAVSADTAQLQNLTTIAREECSGSAGPGTTGKAGVGPMCQGAWSVAETYARRSGLAAKQEQLAALQTSIAGMIQQAGNAEQAYAARLDTAITAAVAEKSNETGRQIGIFDEEAALQQLSAQNTFVLFARCLLWLLLLTLSCLPMLVRFVSGSTAYSELLAEQIAAEERIYLADLKLRERTATAEKEVKTYIVDIAKRSRILDLDQEKQVRDAKETDIAAAVQAFMDVLVYVATAADQNPGTGDTRIPAAQGLRETEDIGLR